MKPLILALALSVYAAALSASIVGPIYINVIDPVPTAPVLLP